MRKEIDLRDQDTRLGHFVPVFATGCDKRMYANRKKYNRAFPLNLYQFRLLLFIILWIWIIYNFTDAFFLFFFFYKLTRFLATDIIISAARRSGGGIGSL